MTPSVLALTAVVTAVILAGSGAGAAGAAGPAPWALLLKLALGLLFLLLGAKQCRHNTAIMTVLFLALGVKYLGDAISGLTT
ncbi:hypothetical protein [Streptomyces anulatus]|uniref:hypothetical protein n=1 Tax=Streptomyces anulatus TaxID=1892 RepID=UPI00341A24AA